VRTEGNGVTRTRPVRDTTVTMQRVAVYLRISTDEEHQPFSLEAQRHRLGAFIESQPGWRQTAIYEDQVSGAKANRPALDKALADARAGRFDVLLVYRVDRFARSLKVLVGLLEELDHAGVAFRSATEPIDTATPTGRMLVQLLGVFAEFERATIIDRVIAGMERKAARGHWPGGALPYGLTVDDDKRLCAIDTELAVVRSIFERYAAGDRGTAAIAAELNTEGLRTRAGRAWSGKGVVDILRNRAYLGQVFFRGAWHPSAEPFIDTALFNRAQTILDERGACRTTRSKTAHPDYLLTGLIKCARCQRNYVGVSGTGKRHRYRYYMCWTRNRYGTGACDADTLRADELEDAVLAAVNDLYTHPDLLLDALTGHRDKRDADASRHAHELASIDAELCKTERAIERYMLAFENGTLPEASFAGRLEQLTRTTEALHARRAAAMNVDDVSPAAPSIDDLARVAADLRHAIGEAPETARKAIVQAFVADLTVQHRQAIQPRYRVLATLSDTEASGVRTQEPLVGAVGLEPTTDGLKVRCSTN
jgi:site-specific DNA recombinase